MKSERNECIRTNYTWLILVDIEGQEQFRKSFIGGLDYTTTNDSLKEFYEKWDDVVNVVAIKKYCHKKVIPHLRLSTI